MDETDAADILRGFWLNRVESSSSQELILATCPFCGKGDRIRLLSDETQEVSVIQETDYQAAWETLASKDRLPAICGFCLNVVLIRDGQAEMPGAQ
ncbi:hypothetical protein [Desulfomonile tiedjei]|uniref:Uncharacterized protein n=1 Tax=Desulfomonile tiedjei (strain ATCC 49306 / DSM 6799 / DCB-1) TaxID=706587 RepID=I4C1Z8_DESTA|nr:hypothetical protein [Desulfomonile tiedjei]AFM23589.1 hypothetical protein Desti_0866 [Desulfomonile tiedjei DSM 6799]